MSDSNHDADCPSRDGFYPENCECSHRFPATPPPPSETGPGAWLLRLCVKFDRLFSFDHTDARLNSEDYDEAFHDAVHALKSLRQFAQVIAPTWTAASIQPPPSETAMQSDNQRPMTPDELEAHGYPRDYHEQERRRFALPPLADSPEAMEGIGPDGEIHAPIQPPPSETKLKEAIEPESFTLGDLRRVGLRALWLSLREVERQQDETEGHGAIVARAISDLMAGDLIDGRDGAGYTALISPKCGEIGEVRALDAFTGLLEAFEVAAVKKAWVRRAFHAGERWVDDGRASHPTESHLLDADNEARAARSSLESLYRAITEENERLREDAERWHALVSSPRVSMLGGARFHQPDWLLAVEFYADEALSGSAKAETIEALTTYADMRRRISSKATSEEL